MKKTLCIVSLIITLVLGILTINVYADSKIKATLKATTTTVEKGKDVIVKLNISDLDNIKNGINSMEGVLKYDTSVFEAVEKDDIEGLNSWSVDYNEEKGKLVFTKLKFATKSEDVCQITLKVKSSATETKGNVKVTEIVASNSDSEISADDASVDISLKTASSSSKNNTTNESNTNTIKIQTNTNNSTKNTNTNSNTNTATKLNTNTNSNSNTNTNNTTNKNNTNKNTNASDEEKMPNTGLDDSIVKAILLLVLVTSLGYIKYKSCYS